MKSIFAIILMASSLILAGCAPAADSMASLGSVPTDETATQKQAQADFSWVMQAWGTQDAVIRAQEFDAKYGTQLAAEAQAAIPAPKSKLSGGGSSYPPLTNLPFSVNGAVYLAGGGDSLVSSVIGWAAPKNLPGAYVHGAALELNKFDPANLAAPSLQTAVTKGAGYESANDWQSDVNVCVLNPNFAVDQAKLTAAQAQEDYYCNLPAGQQAYGFFKGYVDIFAVVPKSDTYWWYCTKVVWDMWHRYGIDLDTNDPSVDFTTSGLYGLAKAYYTAIYFWSSSKASAALASYMNDTKTKIVMAEEIMLSPYLTKVYEVIRK
jgi:hypothetical protein